MYQQPCHIPSARSQFQVGYVCVCVGGVGGGLPWDRLSWGNLGPTLHSRGAHCVLCSLLGSAIQAQHSSIIADRFLKLNIQFLHLIWLMVSATGWTVLENFVLSLGLCLIDSMFGEVLGLLILLLADTFQVISSISAFPWLHCQQLHSTTGSLFTSGISW